MPNDRDIHELTPDRWGGLSPDLLGALVEVRIVCAHAYGLGVRLTSHGEPYGHVNIPEMADGRYPERMGSELVGAIRQARVVAVEVGRQPTLTLRPSRVTTDVTEPSNPSR
ncbi:hypothetical protein GCM10022223_60910 [Kineosporia mesophila]|uniref:S1 motif domain-containing protein n=1 Tax=Kineosporia mesophila TaxID=566012 RepID=A0ABP7AJT6_9ACTN